ncbi:MAG: MvdC/MvdD family ATP grasp protein [Bacteroidales bacterium]
MKKVLIITKSNDNQCIKNVSEAIIRKGGSPIRFNTDTYPLTSALNIEFLNNKWKLELVTENETHDLTDLESVWYRRSAIGDSLGKVLEDKFRMPSVEESRRTFFGLLSSLDSFQFDYYWNVKKAECKQLQLKVAASLGLEIPETLITNNATSVPAFYHTLQGNVITKMQASFAIYENGKENVVFTNPIGNDDLNDLDGLQYCPMTFQRNIEKELELRITIVGDKVFTASINSKDHDKAKNDWRKQGQVLINSWNEYKLPANIETKLLQLMDYFQLNYGAIDMIVTSDNRFVFLEVNPSGEFFWLENTPGFPISETIADSLLNNIKRRGVKC